MKHRWRKSGLLVLMLATCVLVAGCHAKKQQPVNYRFAACQITRTWIDEQGKERKDCDCKNGREIGFDAKTRLRIIRCE
jgi:hypothetical protein